MNESQTACRMIAVGLALGCLPGCWGGPPAVKPPSFDPEASAAQAMEMYDTDRNGALSKAELDQCPAIKNALPEIDVNGDQAVDVGEFTTRVQYYADSQLGRTTLAAAFTLNGQPVEGADVTFEPEPFLSDAIAPATGHTNSRGVAIPRTADDDAPGITAGMFKVRVSLKDAAGNEKIPARYNTQTELGQEISPGSEALRQGTVVFDMYSR